MLMHQVLQIIRIRLKQTYNEKTAIFFNMILLSGKRNYSKQLTKLSVLSITQCAFELLTKVNKYQSELAPMCIYTINLPSQEQRVDRFPNSQIWIIFFQSETQKMIN